MLKVFTRPVGHDDGVWEVILWSPAGHVLIKAYDKRMAGMFADLLVAIIGVFGPNEIQRCP